MNLSDYTDMHVQLQAIIQTWIDKLAEEDRLTPARWVYTDMAHNMASVAMTVLKASADGQDYADEQREDE